MMTRNLIIGLLIAGTISVPAFSYTGTLKDIPTVEHIDETFGMPAPELIKVKAQPKTYKTNPIRYEDVFIILERGKPVAKKGMGFNTKRFVQVIVKKTGKYKYKTSNSITINNKLVVKLKKGKSGRGMLSLRKGDKLMFRNKAVNFEAHLIK